MTQSNESNSPPRCARCAAFAEYDLRLLLVPLSAATPRARSHPAVNLAATLCEPHARQVENLARSVSP